MPRGRAPDVSRKPPSAGRALARTSAHAIPRPTYGSVTATIALFAALAGTSYAAVTVTGSNVRNGTLTGADLKNESVKGSDIDNGSLTGSNLKSRLGTSTDVADGSLLANDFKTGELPAGPAPRRAAGTGRPERRRRPPRDVTVATRPRSRRGGTARTARSRSAAAWPLRHRCREHRRPLRRPADGRRLAPQDGDTAGRWLAGVVSNVSAPRTFTVYVLCAKP